VIDMSEERDVKTTGWVDRGAKTPAGAGPQAPAGATAVSEPRGEAGDPPAAPGSAAEPPGGVAAPGSHPTQPVPGPAPQPQPRADGDRPTDPAPGQQTAPVTARPRPRPRLPQRDPLVRMGPWAPVAGAVVGLALGIVVVVLLMPAVSSFAERLSLVFVVLGLTLLGAGGTLLTDEVRLLRRGAQAVEARAANAGMIAGLLNGLTPARLLITASAFCLLLSAYVTTRS
jgi:hypothetical protein